MLTPTTTPARLRQRLTGLTFTDRLGSLHDPGLRHGRQPQRRTTRLGLLAMITELGEHTLAWEHLHA